MSDESKVSKKLRGTSTRSNPRNQPHEPYDSFFRGDFRRLFKYLESLCKGEPAAQSERDAFTDVVRWCCKRLLKNTAFQGLVLALAILSLWCALYAWGIVVDENGRIDANWAIALLTLAIVIYSILQWSVIKKQTNEFIRQNEIMIEQTDALAEQNELAREQLAHTRYQMKLENRAWLGIIGVELKPLMKGYNKVRCTITVKNSGKTQGKIISGLTNYFVRPMDYPEDGIRYEFEREPLQDQVHMVYPGEAIIIERKPLGKIDDDTIEEIRVGLKQLHVLAIFHYRDVSGDVHEEKGFVTFAGVGPDDHRRANYCSVDGDLLVHPSAGRAI